MRRAPRFAEPPTSKGGAKVREQLLEAAGRVFADQGFQGATSRDICLQAGVNLAAVNYHFGGFEALYVATLKEAHRRAHLSAPFAMDGVQHLPPRERLRAFIRSLVRRLSQSTADSWEMRLVSRELFIPTFAQAEFVASSIEPQRALLRSIVGEIIGRPPDDPVVRRCVFTVIAPCVLLAIINRPGIEVLLPDGQQGGDLNAFIDHVDRFVMAGIDALARDSNDAQDASVANVPPRIT